MSICGNCGISAAPVALQTFEDLKKYCRPVLPFDSFDREWQTWTEFGKYLAAVEKRHPVFQSRALVGHGTLRIAVMGMADRTPQAYELQKMKDLLEQSMQQGALGLSSGLIYVPGVYSKTEELVELCKIVAKYDGIYSTHIRSESGGIVEAVKEAIFIARESGCRLIISHLKVSGLQNEKFTDEIIGLITDARKNGVKVLCDQYQSNKGSTTLAQLISPEFQADGIKGLLAHLKNPHSRQKIIECLKNDVSYENYLHNLGPEQIIIVANQAFEAFDGKNLKEIAEAMNLSAEETVCRLLEKNDGNVLMAVTMCRQQVVDKIFKLPFVAIGSDGIGAGSGIKTHPRAYGNFAHLFQDYVRNRHLVSWQEAVRKCTSLPCSFIGIKNKGLIQQNYDADLVIMDRQTVGTQANFENPFLPPQGIEKVFIKGYEVVDCGQIKAATEQNP